ncbi:hypothetical protein SBE55_28390 [Mycolicibacterium sp. 141076]|uniref:hypothetical protein n=1 Tax=Mycolicibacterium sp. 141076 TaxID=3090599 RepID=UPI00299F10BE|nr:hypothetical protein [Mycolicibacterium sp. 141076]MDX1881709.1 hypothetical protein [Mycolicibacterium sp. 141076]
MSTIFGYLYDHGAGILGVLGFLLSLYNWWSAIRNKTVNPQPQLLAELRGYLDTAVKECQQVKGQLTFDRYLIHTGFRPEIRPRPAEFDTAINRLPELGFTITSVGQRQIDMFHYLIRDATYFWDNLRVSVQADPVNQSALEQAQRLRRLCLMIEKFLPEYVDAIRDINKAHVWKRFKYRDHHAFTYKLFRWTPLNTAINEYERVLTAE